MKWNFVDKFTTDLAVKDRKTLACKPHDVQRGAADPFERINTSRLFRGAQLQPYVTQLQEKELGWVVSIILDTQGIERK